MLDYFTFNINVIQWDNIKFYVYHTRENIGSLKMDAPCEFCLTKKWSIKGVWDTSEKMHESDVLNHHKLIENIRIGWKSLLIDKGKDDTECKRI